jgi:hypothetical protein
LELFYVRVLKFPVWENRFMAALKGSFGFRKEATEAAMPSLAIDWFFGRVFRSGQRQKTGASVDAVPERQLRRESRSR